MNLEKLVQADGEKLGRLEEKKNAVQAELEKLIQVHTGAKRVNEDLEELKKQKEHLQELDSREAEFTDLKKAVKEVTTVLHAVKPTIDAREKAEKDLLEAGKAAETLGEALRGKEAALNGAKALTAGDGEAKKQAEVLGNRITGLEKQLAFYGDLNDRILEQRRAEEAGEKARKGITEAESELKALAEGQEETARQLEEMKNADAEADARAAEEKSARDALDLFMGKGGIAETVKDILRKIAELEREKAALEALKQEAGAAEEVHHGLYQRFIRGQAGLLADDLRRGVEAEGEARCPVCGTVHTRADAAHFAARDANTPSEAQVGEAKEVYDRAERERKEKESRVQELGNTLTENKGSLLRKADPLFPGCSWETVSADGFPEEAEAKLRTGADEAAAALKAAEARKTARNELARKQKEDEEAAAKIAERIESLKKEEAEQQKIAAGAGSAAETLRKTLAFGSAEEANGQIEAWKAELKALTDRISEHAEAEATAQREYDTVRGSLAQKEKEIPGLRDGLETARQQTEKVLEAHGFADAEAALAVLGKLDGTDGEEWIERKNAAINRYDNDRANTGEKIRKLVKDTEGREYTDLQELEARIAEKRDERKAVENECNAGSNTLEGHRGILRKAAEYKAALSSTDSAWKRLDDLGQLAAGYSGAGGKLSFDRYVMGAVFREILEMANRRIDIMSGGKYELVHKIDAQRKDGKAGLEIEVMDTFIGKARPSALLSGGEGFYASLALALGLSDVVQMHAGGKQLDALFIDEGFGTLSPEVLDKALKVLDQLSAGNRLVGIISHVDKLDESIPQKIRVTCDEQGSHTRRELS